MDPQTPPASVPPDDGGATAAEQTDASADPAPETPVLEPDPVTDPQPAEEPASAPEPAQPEPTAPATEPTAEPPAGPAPLPAAAPVPPEPSKPPAEPAPAPVAVPPVVEAEPPNPDGLPAAVLALSDDELKIAAAYYLKKNHPEISRKGVEARQAVMKANLDRIALFVQNNGPVQIPRMSRMLNLSPHLLSHYLQILGKQGRVKGEGHSQRRTYFI